MLQVSRLGVCAPPLFYARPVSLFLFVSYGGHSVFVVAQSAEFVVLLVLRVIQCDRGVPATPRHAARGLVEFLTYCTSNFTYYVHAAVHFLRNNPAGAGRTGGSKTSLSRKQSACR